MKLCIVSHSEYERWQETGKRPGCGFHRHMHQHEAEQKFGNDGYFFLQELRAIIPFTCADKYEWTGKRSGGYQVMQMTSPR